MNIYSIIILATIIIGYFLDFFGDYLNLKALKPELPEEFKDVYDADKYQKSQEYTRVTTRFGFITDLFNLIILLGFWFLGGFNYLDKFVRGFELNSILTGLVYIGLLLFLKMILGIPFSIYSTFVIEERFGFNKTTAKIFIMDLIKSLILGAVLGGIVLGAILLFFEYTGDWAWLYAWVISVAFIFIMQIIFPTVIMPLFNKFTPLEEGELRDKIMAFAGKSEFPLDNIYIMDGSKRSSKSNAFFTGLGKTKRIALFDTLVNNHSPDELVAILAHEIGHYKKKHVLTGTVIGIIHSGIMFYLLSIFLSHKGLFDAFYMDQISVYTGLIFFGLLYSPVELILSIFLGMLSRHNEYQADTFAAEHVDDKGAVINALKNLAKDNLSNLTPHPFYVFLNYSHPPVLDRIKKIKQ